MIQFPKYRSSVLSMPDAGLMAAYLPDGRYAQMVLAKEQQGVLQRANEEVTRERICFSVNLPENRIMHCNGVARWLGYADTDFSLQDYLRIIHPTHALIQCCYSASLLELLMHNEIELQFMEPVCVSLIALKHKTGKYLYCKRECAPFQLTDSNRITEYLCQFTILKEFSNEIYHTRIYRGNRNNTQLNEKLHALVRKKFADYTNFSIQELRILKRYAHQKNSTSEMIGKAFKIEKSTVSTFNKRILNKAETLSQQRFSTAKDAAVYFKDVGLL